MKTVKTVIFALVSLVLIILLLNPEWLPVSDTTASSIRELESQHMLIQGNGQITLAHIATLVLCLCIVWLCYTVIKLILRAIGWKDDRSYTIANLLCGVLKYLAVIVAIVWGLGILGVNMMAVLAGVGLLGLILGFGAQSLIEDIITGIFIMPDTPLMLFWLLAVWMAVIYFKRLPTQQHSDSYMVLFGAFAGFAMLSKYSGIFLWFGMVLYILIFDRKPLRTWAFYCALLISLNVVMPVIRWNINNDFISFRFHGERVGGGNINFGTFGTEIAGEFFYNNPVIFVLAFIAIFAAFKKRINMEKSVQRLILCISMPMIVVFWVFSLMRPTLPHWNAPAYVSLILLSAVYLRDKHTDSDKLSKSIIAALSVLAVTLVVGVAEIKTGFIPLDKHTEPEQLGRDDFTLDMYGWRQLGEKFADFREEKIAEGIMKAEDGIVANQWFPLANLDYYVARPLKMRVMGLGWPEFLHKYLWINDERGGFHLGENYWFLSDSRYMKDPKETYQWFFKEIELAGVIPIERNGKTVKNFFVYTCKGLCAEPPTLESLRAASAEADTTSHR